MTKSFTVQSVAEAIGGRLIGDGALTVSRVAHPSDIRGAEDLALAVDDRLLPMLEGGPARAAVIGARAEPPKSLAACIVIERPRLAMARLNALFEDTPKPPPGIHASAVIEKGAKIGANVTIGACAYVCEAAEIGEGSVLHPQTYIGRGARIGREALIYPGVRIGHSVIIGDRFIAHFNASVGADGFSFVTPQMGSVEQAKQGSGSTVSAANTQLVRIASLGAVEIGDDVEIGANTSIDRGTVVSTKIGSGTKIDNQVQIGHNVVIGENCMLCGRVGIAGSAVIGDRVVLGGAAGVADHVHIGDDAVVMAMSGIAGNIAPRAVVGGIPAVAREKMIETLFNIGRIKQLMMKIKTLGERLDAFEQRSSAHGDKK